MKLRDKRRLDFYFGGLLLFFVKPLTLLLGRVLRRDHDPKLRGPAVFLKFQGGGSLVIALPALLGMRKAYPRNEFLLVTMPSVAPFAETLGVFDRVLCLNDASVTTLVRSTMRALARCVRCDTVIDLEVYSRLSAVFSLLTLARNRIGFYVESLFWRVGIYTHLVFFNRFSGSFHFYERVSFLVGGDAASLEQCKWHLRAVLKLPPKEMSRALRHRVAIGHACSELGEERMLAPEEWVAACRKEFRPGETKELLFFGSEVDRAPAERIISRLRAEFPSMDFVNCCGLYPLPDSIRRVSECDIFLGIDSGLLHYARLLDVPTVSWWGPTAPHTRLKFLDAQMDQTRYAGIPCSPCIHATEVPPCFGDNRCIKALFADALSPEETGRNLPVVSRPAPATNGGPANTKK
jgi:ADP-heptose:LPS heptosyltransferase